MPQKRKKKALESFKASTTSYQDVNFNEADVEIKRTGNAYILRADVNGDVPTTFMSLIGKKNVGFAAIAESAVDLKSVEIALVVDVSWSMRNGKIDPMKRALDDFFDVLYPHPSFQNSRVVSLIPYSDTIHFGDRYRNWLKPDDPPTPVTYTRADGSTYTQYEYLEPRNSELFEGCFQHEPNNQIVSGQVSSVSPGNFLSYVQSYRVGTPLCPSSKSQVRMFDKNKVGLKRAVNDLELGFGTSTDIGTVWGWRALSPSWRSTLKGGQYPKPFAKENIKHLIILTDGKTARADPVGDGKTKNGISREPATSNFKSVCQNIIRQDEIHITTIAYGFSEKENEMRPVLKQCVAKDGQFYEASTSDISSILGSIAKSITEIRLTH